MATAKKSAALKSKKKTPKKVAAKKTSGKGGAREGAGAHKIIPNKVRKTIDIPQEVEAAIESKGCDVSSYMRLATYDRLVKDKLMTTERREELRTYKKKG